MDRTSTPRSRGGHLENLLQLFGMQSSASSATKARRESGLASKTSTPEAKHPTSLRVMRHTSTFTPTPKSAQSGIASPPQTASQEETQSSPGIGIHLSSEEPVTVAADQEESDSSLDIGIRLSSEESATAAASDSASGEEELVVPVPSPRAPSRKELIGELKMEARKKDRVKTPRRSLRIRKDDILASDTVQRDSPASTKTKKKTGPRKLDTARLRLRDEIAQHTKVRADNFLVANKDYFLPLLPERNQVARLVAKGQAGTIVPYKAIKKQPDGITATMKPYQLEGLSFLVHLYNNGFSGLLGDEMGLGKTLQTLSLFQYLENSDRESGVTHEELRPYLVVCPLSVLNNWVKEIEKFTPDLKVLRIHGPQEERERLMRVALGQEDQYGNEINQSQKQKDSKKAGRKIAAENSNSYKIMVTTYETFRTNQNWFKRSFLWRYVVLDEGHRIKNSDVKMAKSLKSISSEFRLILTGTPLQNNLVEMWSLLVWLYPNVFTENTKTLWKDSFNLSLGKVNRKTMDDARHLLELIMIRRMKDSPSVNLRLPPKEEVLLYVPLTPMQRFWYMRLLTKIDNGVLSDLFVDGKSEEIAALKKEREDERLVQKLEKLDASDNWEETTAILRQVIKNEQGTRTSHWQALMNLVSQLRQCCSHPYHFDDAKPDPYYIGQHIVRASGKFIVLEKLLRNSIYCQGKKVLIFAGFLKTLECCEELLSMISNSGQDFKFLRLDGDVPRARRNLDIRLFNDPNSPYKVMLISTRAGGLGINLTAAEDVVFMDEDWNPQITLQAEARAHRIGQTKKVTIYKLCTQGTVEEQMMGRIRKKLYLSTKITESMRNIHGEDQAIMEQNHDTDANGTPKMNMSQLKSLIRRGAQTLSHPDIDINDMLSWDLDTIMQKCRDKTTDEVAVDASDVVDAEASEEKWLSVMERVECTVLDGKRYQRHNEWTDAETVLPDSIQRKDRRIGKNVTVMVGGYAVNKESLNCADWESVPTFAGKDPSLAEPERAKRRKYTHEKNCLVCFENSRKGHLIRCKYCPRSCHYDCLGEGYEEYQSTVTGYLFFKCPQHVCCTCKKKTRAAGGLLYRCRWCPQAFCEDCLSPNQTEELVGARLPEMEMLGGAMPDNVFYIKCHDCIECVNENEKRGKWIARMESSYKKQHEKWIKTQEEEQRRIEKENEELPTSEAENTQTAGFTSSSEDDVPSLTETETTSATPALDRSGLNTPGSDMYRGARGRKRLEWETVLGNPRPTKKRRQWSDDSNEDTALGGYFG